MIKSTCYFMIPIDYDKLNKNLPENYVKSGKYLRKPGGHNHVIAFNTLPGIRRVELERIDNTLLTNTLLVSKVSLTRNNKLADAIIGASSSAHFHSIRYKHGGSEQSHFIDDSISKLTFGGGRGVFNIKGVEHEHETSESDYATDKGAYEDNKLYMELLKEASASEQLGTIQAEASTSASQPVMKPESEGLIYPKNNVPQSILLKFPGLGLHQKPLFSNNFLSSISILSKYPHMGIYVDTPFFTNYN